MIREPIFETRQNVMGGEGELKYYHIETEEELLGHARLYAGHRMVCVRNGPGIFLYTAYSYADTDSFPVLRILLSADV